MKEPDQHLEIAQAEMDALRARVAQLEQALLDQQKADQGLDSYYRALFEQANDAVFIFSPTLELLQINQRAVDLLGYPFEELRGLVFTDVIVKEDYAKIRDALEALRAGHSAPLFTLNFRRRDSSEFPAEVNATLTRDANGQPLYYQSMVRDITERQQAEQNLVRWGQELAEQAQMLDAVLKNTPDHFRIFDREGRFLYVNPASLQALGRSGAAVLGKTWRELDFAPEIGEAFEARLAYVLNTGETVTSFTRLQTVAGERDYETILGPVYDSDGQIRFAISTSRDITEHKVAQEQIRRQENELRLILNTIPAMVWYKDIHNNILRTNVAAAHSLGKTVAELEGHSVASFYPEQAERYAETDQQVIASGQPLYDMIDTLTTRWGEITVQIDKIPIFDMKGRVTGILVVANDISDQIETQRALAESEEKYRLLFQSESDSIILLDIETRRFIDVNQAALNMYGYGPDQFFNLSLLDISDTSTEETETILQQLHLRDSLQIPLWWHRRASGERFPVEISAAAYSWQGREVACIIIRDITERQRDRARILRQNQQLLTVQVATSAITSSLDLRYVLNTIVKEMAHLANVERALISAWNAEENYIYEIAHYGADGWLEEGTEVTRYYLRDYPATRQVIEEQRIVQQIIGQADLDPIEQRFLEDNKLTSLIMVPIVFQGRVLGLVELEDRQRTTRFSNEEITIIQLMANQAGNAIENARLYRQAQLEIVERKRAEAALRESEARYRTLIEASPDPTIMYDLEHRVTYVNPAFEQTFGWRLNEILNKQLDFVPAELIAGRQALQQQMIEQGKLEEVETQRLTKSGQLLDVQFSALVYHDETGQARGSITILRDITERKRAQERELTFALEHERVNMLTNFIKDASHDFRTPLSTINTSLYLLRKHQDPERREHHLHVLQNQTEHLEKLVDGLFTLARLDSNTEMRFQLMSLAEIVGDIKAKAATLAEKKGLELIHTEDGSAPYVLADHVELHRALMGIVINAVQYTSEGVVVIANGTRNNRAYIAVHDTGIGISEADLPRVFDRFYRADKARSTQTGGLGLDLSIAKKIIEKHQGHIEAESRLGEGSSFTVYLPLDPFTPGQS